MLAGRADDTVGNELLNSSFSSCVLFLKLDQQLPVEQFEATVSQSAVPSPPS